MIILFSQNLKANFFAFRALAIIREGISIFCNLDCNFLMQVIRLIQEPSKNVSESEEQIS